MRSFLWISFGGLIVVGALVAVQLTAPPPVGAEMTPRNTSDKVAIGAIVRDYIIANPEILVEAMQELEKRQESQRDSTAKSAVRAYEKELLRDSDSPVGGNPDGDVTLVEFNDYQCPYCKRAFTAIQAVTKADGKVKIIYKDLPILGDASRIAAYAALAAQKQGKHAGFHKALMEFRGQLDRTRILEIAASVDIDVPQLEKDMEEPRIKQVIERNLALAAALGVRGTPAFVIGGQFVPGAIDADALKSLIAEARKKPGSPGR
jgi:protein-disulfide isomerase